MSTGTTHKDNLLGICHALGEDFGFNPIYLRIALAVGLLLKAEYALIAYAMAGALVVASRVLVRVPKTPAVAPVRGTVVPIAPVPMSEPALHRAAA